jgi:signal transduction histidine kinase/ActR/RegA family two-component response regulator/HAMP domain-containing protein
MARRHHLQLRDKASLLVLTVALVIGGLVVAAALADLDAAAIASATTARAVQVRLAQYSLALSDQRSAAQASVLSSNPQRLDDYQATRNAAILAEGRLTSIAAGDGISAAALIRAADTWRTWADAAVAQPPGGVAQSDLDREHGLFAAVQAQERGLDQQLDRMAIGAAVGAWRFPLLAIALPIVGAALLTMLLVVWWRVMGTVLRPIDQLAATARAISHGETPSIPGLERADELGELAVALAAWREEAAHRLGMARSVAEEKERQARVLELLNRAATEMSGVLEPAALAEILVDRTAALLGGVDVLLAVRGSEPDALFVVAHRGEERRPPSFALEEDGIVTRVFRSGEAMVVEDYRLWPDASRRGQRAGLRSAAAVPLVIAERRTGVLAAYTRDDRRLGDGDLRLLALLAAQAAPALEAARLHAELVGTNAELARASRHKSDFLASMSHELRTPLNAMLGFTELVLDYEQTLDPARRAHYMRHIHSSGQHLLTLINETLDLAKVESGQMELRIATFDVSAVVGDVLATMEPLAASAGVELVSDCPAPLVMEADEDKVRQVLLNLVSNAIQFTPEGGRVTVEAAPEAEWIGICVADTGVGIAEEDHERIFEAFQQLNGDAGPPRGGTGLGLALTRRLIELHGGRVRVESRPGQGSRFHVELPTTQRIEPLVEAGQPPDGPLVLVVEDTAGAAALLVGTLRRDGYRTEVVRDHRLAVSEAVRLRPFAITLDILLPGPDGWDVLRALKSSEDTRHIPVVVVSVVDERSRGLDLGADDYLVKPLDRDALRSAIERLQAMNGHRHGDR